MKAATSQRPKGLIPVSLSCSWPRSIATLLLLPGGDVNPVQGYPQLGREARGGGGYCVFQMIRMIKGCNLPLRDFFG